MRTTEAIGAARRAIEICNACRFCDGYCVVFQVMELRRAFSNADLSYMANLCHNCRNCYYACQYAPPHEFSINLPKSFSQIRVETFEEYAWPRPLASLFRRNGVVVSLIVATSKGDAVGQRGFILFCELPRAAKHARQLRGPAACFARA